MPIKNRREKNKIAKGCETTLGCASLSPGAKQEANVPTVNKTNSASFPTNWNSTNQKYRKQLPKTK